MSMSDFIMVADVAAATMATTQRPHDRAADADEPPSVGIDHLTVVPTNFEHDDRSTDE